MCLIKSSNSQSDYIIKAPRCIDDEQIMDIFSLSKENNSKEIIPIKNLNSDIKHSKFSGRQNINEISDLQEIQDLENPLIYLLHPSKDNFMNILEDFESLNEKNFEQEKIMNTKNKNNIYTDKKFSSDNSNDSHSIVLTLSDDINLFGKIMSFEEKKNLLENKTSSYNILFDNDNNYCKMNNGNMKNELFSKYIIENDASYDDCKINKNDKNDKNDFYLLDQSENYLDLEADDNTHDYLLNVKKIPRRSIINYMETRNNEIK